MWFNGILVWLDFASLVADGVLYLSQHDIDHAIEPLMAIPRSTSIEAGEANAVTRPKIIIDPGHGGRDAGAVNEAFQLKEKELALRTSLALADSLRTLGWQVVLTRETDVFIPLADRPRFANERGGDLFVSIHYNAAQNPQAEGIEVFILTTPTAEEKEGSNLLPGHKHLAQSMRLAWHLQHALIRQTREVDRGVRRNRFAVLRDLQQPGVLVELGFLSHEPTARRLQRPETIAQLVNALVVGLESSVESDGDPTSDQMPSATPSVSAERP